MSDSTNIELSSYFDRIAHTPGNTTNYESLAALQLKHMQAIPFENLTPYTGQLVSLNLFDIENKLIRQNRGGYCYEQNLLFANVLKQLGYTVKMLAARVVIAGDNPMPAKTHMLLLVTLDEAYLVDTGFGGNSPTAPLRLNVDSAQQTGHGEYKVEKQQNGYTLKANLKGEFKSLYQFDLCSMLPADYEPMNYYMGTRPDSHFRKELLLAKVSGNTRVSLHNNLLTTRNANYDVIQQLQVDNFDNWVNTVKDNFQINIDSLIRHKLLSSGIADLINS